MTPQAHPLTHALTLLLLAIVFSPSAFAATLDEAAKLVQDGKYEEAVGAYDSIIGSASSLTADEARYGKRLALKALRKYPEAVAYWEELLKPGFINPRQEADPSWLNDLSFGKKKVSCVVTNVSFLDLSLVLAKALGLDFGIMPDGQPAFRNKDPAVGESRPDLYVVKPKSPKSQ